jgi:hypothetical protein
MSKYVNRNIANDIYMGFSFYEKDSNFHFNKKEKFGRDKIRPIVKKGACWAISKWQYGITSIYGNLLESLNFKAIPNPSFV